MLIANMRLDNQVKTYITYNKGRNWRLLQSPATDLAGNDIHYVLPVISLDGRISYTFTSEGMNTVTVQVSLANTILQDTKTIAVQEFFKSLLLSFSPNLDEYKPHIPEWRQDVGRVIKKALLQHPWWIPCRDTAVQPC
ncbi:VPS10 domain-containing receptor SorCS1-like isoform X2 [Oncorhynchus nerka]|uniref:VPS10 domain-containing receptor SorCS1-like isoform X2 n=1 Tax=Oncorhynchus nerka TaxID=8023 RepID=UPI0031B824F3